MIIKPHEIEKLNLGKNKFFLLYGENQGYKNQIIDDNFKKIFLKNTFIFEEAEILANINNFFDQILSQSFFEKEKLIIINRATDKIKAILEEVIDKNIEDLIIVLNSNSLEKKSKIRSLFEKNKNTYCVPFYEDNNQTLNSIISLFFRNKRIPISQPLINVLIERSRGDRKNLKNELEKIENFSLNKKKINLEEVMKLTNLADNYSASDLIDHSLAKNTKKTVTILNENNYSDEDNIIIIRTLLTKLKRLVKIYELVDEKRNIEQAISVCKPPVFWKDKPLVIQQIKFWGKNQLKNLIYKTNEIELLVKKNSTVAKSILVDFIINNSRKTNN